MVDIICISGSVGCGKTTYAKKLAKQLGYTYVDVKKVLRDEGLDGSYDDVRKCSVIDVKKLVKVLLKLLKEDSVVDSHLSHYLPASKVSKVVICKCSLKKLEERLKKRRYSKAKIRENLDCEIFDVCLVEATEAGHTVEVVYT